VVKYIKYSLFYCSFLSETRKEKAAEEEQRKAAFCKRRKMLHDWNKGATCAHYSALSLLPYGT
jgi:hypothetical protein